MTRVYCPFLSISLLYWKEGIYTRLSMSQGQSNSEYVSNIGFRKRSEYTPFGIKYPTGDLNGVETPLMLNMVEEFIPILHWTSIT